ncbi:helix-turn-helix domain-containing protein [Streptomyces sp. NPDC058424]|uniref:helix-turn-helix domain-containing protein n=1 Tax=Streptomyces sp. NPDC058424 TaxID=3346491 RepID=UPI0036595A09
MTDEQKRRGPAATQVEATGRTVRANVARLRKLRNWTTYELAQRMQAIGRPIPQSGISRVESGARRVDADDLAAFAVAFNVSPAALLLPLEDLASQKVEITGAGSVPADVAWEWASNKRPLKFPTKEQRTAAMEYALASLPPNAREVMQHPAGRALEAFYKDMTRAIARATWSVEGEDAHEFSDLLDKARTSLERMLAELDRLPDEHEELVRLRDGLPRQGGD